MNKIDDDVEAASDEINTVVIATVQVGQTGNFKHVRCQLADVPVEFLLDLGAKVSIVSRTLYESLLQRTTRLQPSDVSLRTYSGQPIACLGRIELPVSFDGSRLPSFTFYVTEKGGLVMGVDLFDALGGSVSFNDTTSLASIAAVTSSVMSTISLADYPTLTSGFGRLKGFIHRPHIDLSA